MRRIKRRRIRRTASAVAIGAVAAASLLPAYPAVADNTGNQPPGPPIASFANEEKGVGGPEIHTFVIHCQSGAQPGGGSSPGAFVFTAGRPGHPGRVNDNCRG